MGLGDKIMPEINAEWARKTSKEIVSETVSEQLKKALSQVKSAVENDRESAPIHGVVHKKTIEILKSRGFKIEHFDGHPPREPSYTTISW